MRLQGRGLVVVVSSVMGREVTPCLGLYTASKHALEALAETYRYELAPLGIDVCIVQPGTFPTTRILENLLPADDSARTSDYGIVQSVPQAVFGGIERLLQTGQAPNPQLVASAIVDLVMADGVRPSRVVVDPNGIGGASRLNALAATVQRDYLTALGLEWMDPKPAVGPEGRTEEQGGQLIRAIIQEAPIVVYAKDVQRRLVLSNRQHVLLVGRPEREMLGRTDTDLFGPEAQSIEAATDSVLSTREPSVSEFQLTVGGAPRTYLETIFPLLDSSGSILGVGGIATDITSRRALEDEVRQRSIEVEAAHRQLQAMFDALPDLVFTVDRFGMLSCVKHEPANDLAVPAEQAEGMRMAEILPPDVYLKFDSAIQLVLAGGKAAPIQYSLVVQAGPQDFEARIAKQSADEVTVIVRNVTENVAARRTIEEHRGRLQSLLVQQNQVEEALRVRVASEVHDGVAQEVAMARILVAKVAADVPEAAPILDLAAEVLDGALRHINDLVVEISPPALRTLGLVPALRDAAERVAARHGLKCVFSVVGELPDVSNEEKVAVYWVARELMANVAKHARASVVEVRLDLTSEWVRVSVRDDGIGISVPAQPASGVGGFGLFGARERMRQVGGTLSVERRERGTEGIVTLPVRRSPAGR
jgi:PAS domain S-box-containing protein